MNGPGAFEFRGPSRPTGQCWGSMRVRRTMRHWNIDMKKVHGESMKRVRSGIAIRNSSYSSWTKNVWLNSATVTCMGQYMPWRPKLRPITSSIMQVGTHIGTLRSVRSSKKDWLLLLPSEVDQLFQERAHAKDTTLRRLRPNKTAPERSRWFTLTLEEHRGWYTRRHCP